jgi:phage tail sheath protein FI
MQEVDVPGPIPGVSTGIAAIVGPAESGPINTPVFVTNWTQFTETFGGYSDAPPVYATHAVRGFFENGGNICCFVRVGVARPASFTVADRTGKRHPVFTVTALAEGEKGNSISVALSEANLCVTTAKKCAAEVKELSADLLKLTMENEDAAKSFVPGDLVSITQGSVSEEAEVALIAGSAIVLKTSLIEAFNPAEATPIGIRLGDPAGKKRLRLTSTAKLEPGSYLQISQPAKVAGEADLVEYALVESLDASTVLVRAAFQEEFSLQADSGDIAVQSLEFSLTISQGANKKEYKDLSIVPYHSRYYEKLTAEDNLVALAPADPPNPSLPPYNLPDPGYALNTGKLSGGINESLGGLTPPNYLEAIKALERVKVNLVCVPDAVVFGAADPTVSKALVEHCQRMGDRFAILDCARDLSVQGATDQREKCIGSSSFGAAYYPWIEIPHPMGLGRLKVPPSGHVAGVFARTDEQKGVHKAPGNEIIMGCLGPATQLNDTEHGLLNDVSINAIVNIPGSGATLMGARTLSDSTQWRYINVRRLLLYVENSIQEATRFAVFLPNNPSLWATVKRQVSDFLTGVWRSGALFGATSGQAFRVKVDEELNPPSVRALGQLIIEIVLYPVTPAEYVVFRVIQQPGGATVDE